MLDTSQYIMTACIAVLSCMCGYDSSKEKKLYVHGLRACVAVVLAVWSKVKLEIGFCVSFSFSYSKIRKKTSDLTQSSNTFRSHPNREVKCDCAVYCKALASYSSASWPQHKAIDIYFLNPELLMCLSVNHSVSYARERRQFESRFFFQA